MPATSGDGPGVQRHGGATAREALEDEVERPAPRAGGASRSAARIVHRRVWEPSAARRWRSARRRTRRSRTRGPRRSASSPSPEPTASARVPSALDAASARPLHEQRVGLCREPRARSPRRRAPARRAARNHPVGSSAASASAASRWLCSSGSTCVNRATGRAGQADQVQAYALPQHGLVACGIASADDDSQPPTPARYEAAQRAGDPEPQPRAPARLRQVPGRQHEIAGARGPSA